MSRETILYVDDEIQNLELFEAYFEEDYEVVLAKSGPEGLDILNKLNNIKVVISDVKMPEMNGFEFIQKVKLFAPDKVCIILSAFRESDFTDSSVPKEGIFRYMNKPWQWKEMNDVIISAINSYMPQKS